MRKNGYYAEIQLFYACEMWGLKYYFVQQNGGRWYTRSFVQDMIKRKVKRKLLKAQIKDLRSEFKEQIKSQVTEEK